MRERVDLKSPVREYRPPGSVRGASGNRRPYLDRKQRSECRAKTQLWYADEYSLNGERDLGVKIKGEH